MKAERFLRRALAALWLAAGLISCDNMKHQENVRPFEASAHFADGASARHPPAHTVARGEPAPDDPVATGQKGGVALTEIPVPLTRDLLERGRERFNIFCAACHGEDGFGRGMVVRRGFPAPPSYQEPWLLKAPAGHFFTVITHGIGRMYPLGNRIEPRDRWAIVAYVRALQRSQHATLDDVSPAERQQLSPP
jgi:mono/diheme cytochrome c family protein